MLLKRVLTILLLLSFSLPAWGGVSEYELKAAFMEKFTRFVEWPGGSKGHFQLCIIGKNLFKGELKKLESLAINGRPTLFTQMSRSESAVDCDMLFIEKTQHKALEGILVSLQNRPVLTISDTPGFAHQGVMINFIRKNNKLHFEINQQAAETVGLKISSRLLKLAIMMSSTGREKK